MIKINKLWMVTIFFLPAWSSAQTVTTDEQILEMFQGLRVADVSDGLDMVGLRDVCLLDTKN